MSLDWSDQGVGSGCWIAWVPATRGRYPFSNRLFTVLDRLGGNVADCSKDGWVLHGCMVNL